MASGLPEPEEPEEPIKPDEPEEPRKPEEPEVPHKPEEPQKPEEPEEPEIDRTGLSRRTKVLNSWRNDEFSSSTLRNFKPIKVGNDHF